MASRPGQVVKKKSRAQLEAIAKQTLLDHGLLSIPVNPVEVAQALHFDVKHAVFRDNALSGLCARRSGKTTILVRQGDHPIRKRFTVAHEIGHALLHLDADTPEIADRDDDFFRTTEPADSVWSERRQHEFEANAFAAGLLMPAELVRHAFKIIPARDRTVAVMADTFQVSEQAMGIRLSMLGLL